MSGSLRVAFVMDPLDGMDIDKDTTFVLMLEAQARGHRISFLENHELFVEDGRPSGTVREVKTRRAKLHYDFGDEETIPLDTFDLVFMRKDPPYTIDYIYATLILGMLPPETPVINNPTALRNANEKLYALNFPELVPRHLVSKEIPRLLDFMKSVGGEMIVKPLGKMGGSGVLHLHEGHRNNVSLLELLTNYSSEYILAQRYLPEVRRGDKRVIVLNGEPIGATLRVPQEHESRANIHVGGQCVKAEIDDRDRAVCTAIGPRLRAEGLYLIGLDMIGGYLTEINVTSPTGIQEINALDGVRLEEQVIDFAETLVAEAIEGRGRGN